MVEKVSLAKHPIDRTDAGEVSPLVQKLCVDGIRSQIGESRLTARPDDLLALFIREATAHPFLCAFTAVYAPFTRPALGGADTDAERLTRCLLRGTLGYRLFDEAER